MYFIKVNDSNDIIEYIISDTIADGCIELTEEEYRRAGKYSKFNPESWEFSNPIEECKNTTEILTTEERISQLEEALGILAEQSARQSLEM